MRKHAPSGRRGRVLAGGLVGPLAAVLLLGTLGAPVAAAPPPDRPGQQQSPGAQPSAQKNCAPGEKCPEEKPPPDTQPPAAPALGAPVVKPRGKVTLPAVAEERSRIEVRDGDELVAAARATGQLQDLTWTEETGTYTYTVTATDDEDNESEPATVDVDVDADPPVVQRFVVTPGDARAPESTIVFATEPSTSYSLRVDDKEVVGGTTPETGVDPVRQVLDLADGKHPVELRLTDETGNKTQRTKQLVVKIGDLFVAAELTTGPTDPEQVVDIDATPGTRGTVRVPGGENVDFRVDDEGEALVRLDLADGTYEDGSVVVRDVHDRRGVTPLREVVVDTTPPVLEAEPVTSDLVEGLMSLEVTADAGSMVDWRVRDAAGIVVSSGRYVASGAPQVLSRDLDEGAYTVELSTVDVYDRATEIDVDLDVAADPISWPVVAAAAVALLLLLLVLALVVRRLWRRRRERRALEPEPASHESLAAYERAEAAWVAQHQALSRLADVAHGAVPDDVALPAGFVLAPDEKPFWCVGARLLHVAESEGQEVALEGEQGDLVVTDQRFAFVGPGARDWWHPMVERVRHVGQARTLVAVHDVEGWAGFAYDDPQLTRAYVDLAASSSGDDSYAGLVERGLRDHEMRRPSPPA
jgi:hypothetical protein